MQAILFITLCLLLLTAPSHGAFKQAQFSVDSFREAAKEALKPYGYYPIDILFQDSAVGVDQEIIHDGAMVFALSRATNIANSFGNYRLAYRLLLGTGQTDVVFLRYTSEGNRTIVLPEYMTLSFEGEMTGEEYDQALRRLKKVVGNSVEMTPSPKLKRVTLELIEPSVQSYMRLYDLVLKSPEIGVSRKLAYSYEKYALHARHGVPWVLTHEKRVDLDRLRDVVPTLISEGKKITTDRSFVPGFLQKPPLEKNSCLRLFQSM